MERVAQGNAENKVFENDIEYADKTKPKIVVSDELVDAVIAVVQKNAHTERPGDGKIFLHSVDEAVKIRTGESGRQAI